MVTSIAIRTESSAGSKLCAALGMVGALVSVINPLAGTVAATVGLVWSLVASAGSGVRGYRTATWISAAALLINAVVLALSLTASVSGATSPVVVPAG